MTTNFDLPFKSASIIYHFGVSLVFLSLISYLYATVVLSIPTGAYETGGAQRAQNHWLNV